MVHAVHTNDATIWNFAKFFNHAKTKGSMHCCNISNALILASENDFFLAYRTRFSAIFTSADKPYLTYPYPIRGIDKKRITTPVVNNGCIGSHVTLSLRRWELTPLRRHIRRQLSVGGRQRDTLMATPMLKSNSGDQKVCKKKNLSWFFCEAS